MRRTVPWSRLQACFCENLMIGERVRVKKAGQSLTFSCHKPTSIPTR